MAESTLRGAFSDHENEPMNILMMLKKGIVARQDPEAGTVVVKRGQVNVVISNGTDKLELSKLGITDLDQTTAVSFLESKGLKVQVVEEEKREHQGRNRIMRYEPEPGGLMVVRSICMSAAVTHVDKVPAPYLKASRRKRPLRFWRRMI
ncbi:MAG: hypothetical protein ACLUD2_17775 [Clostridium sp.]